MESDTDTRQDATDLNCIRCGGDDDVQFVDHDGEGEEPVCAPCRTLLTETGNSAGARAGEDIPGTVGERPDDAHPGDAHADGAVDASIPGASDPLDQTLTEYRCPQCGAGGKWTGPLTADMVERTYTRGVNEATGLPNCIYCGTATDPVNFLAAEDAISQAAERLDRERAGDGWCWPQHQPSLPGIRPIFDGRSAQLTTESLEENVASAESLWESAKKTTAARKSDFDDAVAALREHIQETHRARVDAEYQHGKDTGPIAPAPAAGEGAGLQGCLTERTTGKPCPICRNLTVAPADNDTRPHLAAAILMQALEETLSEAAMTNAIKEITGVVIHDDDISLWTSEDYQAVARYLETYTSLDVELAPAVERPVILGRPHQAGDIGGGCRVCGAKMQVLAEACGFPDGFPSGTLVGLDCPGESEYAVDAGGPAEPARKAKPRHAKPADRQKAKQAAGTKDHAAAQRAEGAKKSTDKKKPAKAALKGAAKKRTTR